MNRIAFKRTRLVLSLTALALAVGAIAAAGPAAAETQHWASAPIEQIPPGGTQSFSSENVGQVTMRWYFTNSPLTMECSKLSDSGTVENPSPSGSGTLSGTSLELSGCTINIVSCRIANESIQFEELKGHALEEGGEEKVRIEPEWGSTIAMVKFESTPGRSCYLGSQANMSGYFEGTAVRSKAGGYSVSAMSSHLSLMSKELQLEGEFSLATPAGKPLALSSENTPGEPHWFVGSSEWTPVPSGEQVSYFSTAVPLTLNFIVGLAQVEISGCEGLFAGSVENPAGGGAGTTTAVFTPGWASGCHINVASCRVEYTEPVELQGAATEIGGVPAVEWTGTTKGKVMEFHLEPSGSGSGKCAIGTQIVVTGKLITTSENDGTFRLAANGLLVGTHEATISHTRQFALESQKTGEYLRLQP